MGNPTTRQHDPLNIVINVGGRDISGYAEGTFVESERYADAFSMNVGSDGEVTRIKSNNRSGYWKFTLQQSSPSNDYLSSLGTQDEETSNAVVPVLMTDKNGTTITKGAKCWVKKKPKAGFSNASENREWTIDTGNLQIEIGGQNEI